jgi:hypothetical protein
MLSSLILAAGSYCAPALQPEGFAIIRIQAAIGLAVPAMLARHA